MNDTQHANPQMRVPYGEESITLAAMASSVNRHLELESALGFLGRVVGKGETLELDEFETRGLSVILETLVAKVGKIDVDSRQLRAGLKLLARDDKEHIIY